jgi:hypothetical protein
MLINNCVTQKPDEHTKSPADGVLKLNNCLLNHRAVLHTCTASCATINVDGACSFLDFDLEIPWLAFYSFKISICDQLDI